MPREWCRRPLHARRESQPSTMKDDRSTRPGEPARQSKDASFELTIAGRPRRFFYRSDSVGDTGVVEQIFRDQDYALDRFRRFPAFAQALERLRRAGLKPLILDA